MKFGEFLTLVTPRLDMFDTPNPEYKIASSVGDQKQRTGSSSHLKIPDTTDMKSTTDSGISEDLDLEQVFKIYDKNGDGYITKQEIIDVMHELGEAVTEEDASEMTGGHERLTLPQFKMIVTAPYSELLSRRTSTQLLTDGNSTCSSKRNASECREHGNNLSGKRKV